MEASTLSHSGHAGLRSPAALLRLHGDEKLVALTRRGNQHAYEALVARYQSRLLAFCRHMLGSREDAEDVLQEVFAAAFNAMLADGRAINVRPWLYRIARNRCLNHLRRTQAVAVDSMDVHFAEHGATTAEKVHDREEFRLLIDDVRALPETQRTALLLREIDALSYEQIAEAMETTVPGIKSLLVRARVSLAEAAEARLLSCDEVRLELGEVAEGLKRTSAPVRRHLRSCERCATFKKQLRETNRALAAMFPVGPLLLLKKFVLTHAGATASAGSATATAGASAAAGGALSTGIGAVVTKAAAGLAAAAIVTAGAVEVNHPLRHAHPVAQAAIAAPATAPVPVVLEAPAPIAPVITMPKRPAHHHTAAKPEAKPEPPPAPPAPAEPATAAPDAQQPPATAPEHDYDSTTLPQPAAPGAATGGAVAPEEQPAPAAAVPTTAPAPPATAPAPPATAPAPPAPASANPALATPPPADVPPPADTPQPPPPADVAPPGDPVGPPPAP